MTEIRRQKSTGIAGYRDNDKIGVEISFVKVLKEEKNSKGIFFGCYQLIFIVYGDTTLKDLGYWIGLTLTR